MKKLFSLILVFFIAQSVHSFELDEDFGFEKAMFMRNDIQNSLNLSAEQQVKRTEINAKYHPLFNEKFLEIGDILTNLRILAETPDCTEERVEIIKKDFEIAEEQLFEVNKNYEKEFRTILKPRQKVKYSVLRWQNRVKLRRELNKQIKNEIKNELKQNA